MGAITLSLDGFEDSHNWLRANKKSFGNAIQALELITSNKRLFYDVVTCEDYKNCNGGAMHLWDEKQDCIMTCINDRLKNNAI